MTKFCKITVNDWRQFSNIDLSIHPRMTIITGANGAGKTTLLRLMSQHFGWYPPLLATPKRKSGSPLSYVTGLFKKLSGHTQPTGYNQFEIGTITYSNGITANLLVPESSSSSYQVSINNQQQINGLSINSHRPVQSYQAISSIPTNVISAEDAYNTYSNELISRFNNSYTQFSPIYRMKETIISMAMFGAGNQYVQKDENLEKLFLDFKKILSEILPPSIGFLDISVRIPDVVLVTKSGEFMIDAASGGLMSLIDLSWQIFLYSVRKDEFTVLLDEPENHLHPSMQRSLLDNLTRAFPKAQFIVATHSPFMVSSVKDSIVHALRYSENGSESTHFDQSSVRVSSIPLDLDTRAATANEILRDVLGVPVTLPLWAENDLRNITSRLTAQTLTAEGISQLRQDLEHAGLGEYYPEALKMAADR